MSKFKVVNGKGKYKDDEARCELICYILKKDRAINQHWGGAGVDLAFPILDMENLAEQYEKNKGVRIRHFILAFSKEEVTDPKVAKRIGQQIADFLGQEYQIIFAVHENTDELHVHFAMNAISHDGKRYHGTRKDFYTLFNFVRRILKQRKIRSLKYVSSKDEEE